MLLFNNNNEKSDIPQLSGQGNIPIESVREALVGDAATTDDALHMAGYVNAVARFLSSKETVPPLTMSIEGEWGSGKSSFMLQLAKKLKEKENEGALIVNFNAWRYEKHEALWAAFALNFVRTLQQPKSLCERLAVSLSLLRARLDFEEGAWRIWRTVAMLIAVLVLFVVFLCEAINTLMQGSWLAQPGWLTALLASTLLVVTAAKHAWSTVGSPFENDLKKYFDSPDYRGNRAFVEMFHIDFKKIVASYVKPGQRVFVFIDDLDRCEIGRAADLLQALNLLMSGEGLPLIYVLGIDREIVSASVAASWAKQVEYLFPDASTPAAKTRATMRFALDYLEKFVQIPFRVPVPSRTAVKKYIEALTGATSPRGLPKQITASAPIETVWIDIGADSESFRTLCEHVAPLLDNNPRRIKQFLNVLRLNAVVAHQRGAFRTNGTHEALALEQLARFLAIVLRYPAIVGEMRAEPELLINLEKYSLLDDADLKRVLLADLSGVATEYTANSKLMLFLRNGSNDGKFSGVDFDALLQTVPELTDRTVAAPPVQAVAASTSRPTPDVAEGSVITPAEKSAAGDGSFGVVATTASAVIRHKTDQPEDRDTRAKGSSFETSKPEIEPDSSISKNEIDSEEQEEEE